MADVMPQEGMRALTLTQPWTGLMAAGIKRIENRSRPMIRRSDFGKLFALHASREVDESIYGRIGEIAPELAFPSWLMHSMSLAAVEAPPWYRLSRITGAVIAVAAIAGVVVDRRCGASGVDGGHCRRCGLVPEGEGVECPPGFFASTDIDIASLGDQRRWYFGSIGYVFRDVYTLTAPVPCRGYQSFWRLTPDVQAQVISQLMGSA